MLDLILVSLFWLAFLVPGHAIYHRFFFEADSTDRDGCSAWSFAFVLSGAVFLPAILSAYLFRLTVPMMTALFWIWTGAFIVIQVLRTVKTGSWRRGSPSKHHKHGLDTYFHLAFYMALGGFALIAATIGGSGEGDAWVHLAKITMNMSNWIGYGDPFFGLDIPESRYHLTLTHPLMAIGAYSTGLPASVFWSASALSLNVLTALAVFTLARMLSGSFQFASVAAILWMVLQGDSTKLTVQPNNIAWKIVIPLTIAAICRYVQTDGKRWFWIVTACMAIMGTTHVLFSVYAILFLLLAVTVSVAFSTGTQKPDLAHYKLLIPASIPLPFILYTHFLPDNLKVDMQDFSEFTMVHAGSFFALEISGTAMMQVVGISFGIWCLWRFAKSGRTVTILLAAWFGLIYSIVYNPLLFPVANKVLPAWAIWRGMRTTEAVGMIVIAYGAYAVFFHIMQRSRTRVVAAFLALVILTPILRQKANRAWWEFNHNDLFSKFEYLVELLPLVTPGAVILASPEESFRIPALLNNRVVSIHNPYHANRVIADLAQRVENTATMLHPGTPATERERLYRKYNVEFVLPPPGSRMCAMSGDRLVETITPVTPDRCLIRLKRISGETHSG